MTSDVKDPVARKCSLATAVPPSNPTSIFASNSRTCKSTFACPCEWMWCTPKSNGTRKCKCVNVCAFASLCRAGQMLMSGQPGRCVIFNLNTPAVCLHAPGNGASVHFALFQAQFHAHLAIRIYIPYIHTYICRCVIYE